MTRLPSITVRLEVLEGLGPVVAGDTIHVECEVIEARRSKNRDNRGLVRTRNIVVKQVFDVVR